jgi:hypothetical protein
MKEFPGVDAVELALVVVDDQLVWLQCDVRRGEVRRHVYFLETGFRSTL